MSLCAVHRGEHSYWVVRVAPYVGTALLLVVVAFLKIQKSAFQRAKLGEIHFQGVTSVPHFICSVQILISEVKTEVLWLFWVLIRGLYNF